ncbi:MAG TPA: hypothetical protein VKH82_19200 [Candidatus Binatia bacterium]|nr:hypothetical protein [Candidatus Binatia bacterium]
MRSCPPYLRGLTLARLPTRKCSIAENKAAAKKIAAKLKCQEKALEVGAVDPTCLTAAETKFNEAIAKAEAAGGCAVTGDGPRIESAVDACVSAIATLTSSGASTTSTTTSVAPTTTSTTLPSNPVCCATAPTLNIPFNGCTMAAGQCAFGTMQPGVCRSDGTCGTASGPGPCCDFSQGCIVLATSPDLNRGGCEGVLSGTFTSSGVCTPTGCQ